MRNPPVVDWVPVEPIRAAVLTAMDRDPELSWSVLCERLGMNRYDGKVGGETSRLKRQLGIMEENDGKRMSNGTKRPKRVRERIHHDHAVKIIRELGIDPLDAGL